MALMQSPGPEKAFKLPDYSVVDSPWPSSATEATSRMSFASHRNLLSVPSPNVATPGTPQDPVAPSPSTSDTGTLFNDVDEDEEPDIKQVAGRVDNQDEPESTSARGPGLSIATFNLPSSITRVEDDPPQSVIHIPSGFGRFEKPVAAHTESKDSSRSASYTSNSTAIPTKATATTPGDQTLETNSAISAVSGLTAKQAGTTMVRSSEKFYDVPIPPTPLQTSLPTAKDWSSTPRAQTRQDLADFSRPPSSLASITEGDDYELSENYVSDQSADEANGTTRTSGFFRDAEDEIYALKTALSECWTLCNTLASLSYIHRERIFTEFPGKGDRQEHAWKACWKLCQNLYNSRDDNNVVNVRPTLDLCRDFCQALFDIRLKENDAADSVLRVSFELNNHLFNTHDRSLPEAFRERTLDFYITLCHRLMKQRSRLAEETDSLLKACWSLAEMLFSLRQSSREKQKPDEELLGSAIQACWELCDLFREGWTQIRPERGTPRPSQTTFTQAYQQAKRAGFSYVDDAGNLKTSPETPTTIFDDSVIISPDEAPVPNILVLNADRNVSAESAKTTSSAPAAMPQPNSTQRVTRPSPNGRKRWSSTSSTNSLIAGLEDTSASSSTQTVRTEEPFMTLLKSLFVRVAVATNRGFLTTNGSTNDVRTTSLPAFAKSLPDTAFGSQAWQMTLLDNYKKTIANDPTFKSLTTSPSLVGLGPDPNKGKEEIAMAVRGMVAGTYGWGWLRDLYRFGYGMYVEEVLSRESGNSQNSSKPNNGAGGGARRVLGGRSRSAASSG